MSSTSLRTFFQKPAFGLLVMRLTIGALMTYYGAAKFLGAFNNGVEQFGQIGKNIVVLGIPAPDDSITAILFGIAAASAEFFGGICLVLGWFFRPAALAIFFTMVVATVMKIQVSDGELSEFAYAMVMGLITFGLLWTGPGGIALEGESKAKSAAPAKKPAKKK
ncbi:MAG: DoxX family protein [Verrucomicrobiota bacterium JB022]|nr:DoxX family protein [Verrucomicrobiota bacterium JB022]